jgi:leucyl aminopeptidase
MSVSLKQNLIIADEKSLVSGTHLLFVLPMTRPKNLPFSEALDAKLKRTNKKYSDLLKTALIIDLPNGAVASWITLDSELSTFKRHTLLRKAVKPLLDENPAALTIAVYGADAERQQAAKDAFYVAAVNAAELPEFKGKSAKDEPKAQPLKTIQIFGWSEDDAYLDAQALVNGNTLTRTLTMTPPNELTPTLYLDKIKKLAKTQGWKTEVFDMKKLKKMGAGAFVAVGQGSDPQDAAIVRLTYAPKKATQTMAIVGKGICFDTGGHNLKPAKYMNGMHEDMNGSAVALGVLTAATEAKFPIKIDCWLAIAQNHIGPLAYKQNDIVTALNGMTIEIVHTDAEGRMVLADTLTLASRQKPSVMIDFATLTGTMMTALGDRYSGVLGNDPAILCKAVGIGAKVGERVCAFPFDEDYDEEIESSIADIKQCTLDGGADHVHAARFLSKFIENDIPWLHIDLSSYNRKGGLGAVASDVNGFGVALTYALIKSLDLT